MMRTGLPVCSSHRGCLRLLSLMHGLRGSWAHDASSPIVQVCCSEKVRQPRETLNSSVIKRETNQDVRLALVIKLRIKS